MDGQDNAERARKSFLRAEDQVTLVVLVVVCLLAIMVHWYLQGLHRGERIEIDRAEPIVVQFEIDLNTADWPKLTLLPGIGKVMAQRIVAHRDRCGPFGSVEELQEVNGIGPKTMRRIGGYLRVSAVDEAVGESRE